MPYDAIGDRAKLDPHFWESFLHSPFGDLFLSYKMYDKNVQVSWKKIKSKERERMIRWPYFFLLGYLNHKEEIHSFLRKRYMPHSLQSPYFLPYSAYELHRSLARKEVEDAMIFKAFNP